MNTQVGGLANLGSQNKHPRGGLTNSGSHIEYPGGGTDKLRKLNNNT